MCSASSTRRPTSPATTANQQASLRGTFHNLPGFLEQLRPALQKLGAATDANRPVAGEPQRRLRPDQPAVHRPAAVLALGAAGDQVARPGLDHRQGRGHRREADDQASERVRQADARAGEEPSDRAPRSRGSGSRGRAGPRSPGGKGFTGLQALLGYVFNQTLAINTFAPVRPRARRRRFRRRPVQPVCVTDVARNSTSRRSGPATATATRGSDRTSPAINTTDPSNPTACVPDPGGAPPGPHRAPSTTTCKLAAADARSQLDQAAKARRAAVATPAAGTGDEPDGSTAASGSGGRQQRQRRERWRESRDVRSAQADDQQSLRGGASAASSAGPRRVTRSPAVLELTQAGQPPDLAARARAPDSPASARPSSSSTTCWRHSHALRGRTQSAFTNPVAGRGDHRARRDGRACSSPTTPTPACRSSPRASSRSTSRDGSNLVPGNDVREGGFRIGLVDSLKPIRLQRRPGRRPADAEARPEERRRPDRLDGLDPARARSSG